MAELPRTPRLAGRRIRAVARSLGAPLAGKAIARVIVRNLGLARLHDPHLADAEVRPVIQFRVAPPAPPSGRRETDGD